MEPFKIPSLIESITGEYPHPDSLLKAAREGDVSRTIIARLWLSEGIPFAFRHCPGLYEVVRTWIAGRLGVEPKSVNITGTGRLGKSLSPSKIGKEFDESSDLDLFIISEALLQQLAEDFSKWSYDFECGNVQASNNTELGFWRNNNERGPKIIQRGFLDSNMIPNHPEYAVAKNIARTMWLLKEKLAISTSGILVSKASVRVYRSWTDYVRQVSLGLG